MLQNDSANIMTHIWIYIRYEKNEIVVYITFYDISNCSIIYILWHGYIIETEARIYVPVN